MRHRSASKHVEPFFLFVFKSCVLFTIVRLKHMITLHLLELHIINKRFFFNRILRNTKNALR